MYAASVERIISAERTGRNTAGEFEGKEWDRSGVLRRAVVVNCLRVFRTALETKNRTRGWRKVVATVKRNRIRRRKVRMMFAELCKLFENFRMLSRGQNINFRLMAVQKNTISGFETAWLCH